MAIISTDHIVDLDQHIRSLKGPMLALGWDHLIGVAGGVLIIAVGAILGAATWRNRLGPVDDLGGSKSPDLPRRLRRLTAGPGSPSKLGNEKPPG